MAGLRPARGERGDGAARGNGCSGTLYGVGHLNYSTRDSRLTDSIVGLEYDAGCWIGRVVVERLSTGRSEATTRLLLQLELVGLSRIGSQSAQGLEGQCPRLPAAARGAHDDLTVHSRMTDLQLLCRRAVVAGALCLAAAHGRAPRPATTSSPSSTRSSSPRARCSSGWRASATRRRATGTPLPPPSTLRKQVLDTLIDERVLVTNARESGARIDDPEIDRAVANVATQNQMTLPQLRERLRQEGIRYAKFRDNIRDQMHGRAGARARGREPDQDQRCRDRRADREAPHRRGRGHADQHRADPGDRARGRRRRRRRRAARRAPRRRSSASAAGEDFAAVAREVSEDSNRAQGGEIGMRPARSPARPVRRAPRRA